MPPKKSGRRPQQPQKPRPAAVAPPPPESDADGVGDAAPDAVTSDAVASDAPATAVAEAADTTPPAAPRRRLERVKPGSPSTRSSRRAEFAPLDAEDAAIPIDRVPYVPSDLRRVAAIALLMFALIIVGGYLISQQVH